MDSPDTAAFLIETLRTVNVTKMVDTAACSIFLWDYLITIGMEVEYVWTGRWSTMKVLYLIQRYLPFIDTLWMILHKQFGANLNSRTCKMLTIGSNSCMLVGLATSESILTLRAWAVWNRNRTLTFVLPVLFAACWIPPIVILYQFLKSIQFGPPPLPQFLGCLTIEANSTIIVAWFLLLAWDTIIMVLMIIPALRAYHFRGHSALYSTVYAEGIMYYIYLFAMALINIILLRLQSIDVLLRFVVVTMSRILHSILPSRAVLHIRARVNRDANEVDVITADEDHHPRIPSGIKSRLRGMSYTAG
ncbi:hypothetical protein NLJ89_g360 [Agrocybe chaxingu]|uniref:DUF6533 domain-containing protein n=1 Tax=Agrocybe chaxingu TaxID=84603 RepID=A0A9W8N236_9AGAR|nr:hypothetical protein NLJ89_g360 [Agrocybe chaxingu]